MTERKVIWFSVRKVWEKALFFGVGMDVDFSHWRWYDPPCIFFNFAKYMIVIGPHYKHED